MKARDLMSAPVVCVEQDTPVKEIAQRLLEHRISAVPVVDGDERLVGMVSEGDLIRRAETGTERQPSWWLKLFGSDDDRLRSYIRSHGQTARDVMTKKVAAIDEEMPIGQIAELLERRRIKRVPVLRDQRVVGIVSRANLIQALAALGEQVPELPEDDRELREQVLDRIDEVRASALAVSVMVQNGRVQISGMVNSELERDALRVAAEAVVPADRLELELRVVPPEVRNSRFA